MLKTKAMRLLAPALAVAGWLGMSLPSTAVTASYANDYRVCAARLLSVGITPQGASSACATALRPKDLASCVAQINRRTQIAALDALSSCRQARRPQELSTCVVGISLSSKEAANPAVLNYCGRSLLPARFAECVVGLRKEIDFAIVQAMDSCIDAGERVSTVVPSLPPATLPTRRSLEFQPTFETTPIPTTPGRR